MVSATPTHDLFSVSSNSAFATSVSDDKSQSKSYCFSHSTNSYSGVCRYRHRDSPMPFLFVRIYANCLYIKKKTEIKSPSFLLVDYFQIFSNYFSKYTRKNAPKCPLVVRGFYTEPITKYEVNNNKVFTFIEK